MKNEIYHTLNIVKCECSVNSIDYDATDLIIILDRFDNNQTFTIRFKNVYAYRVTLEHFRITEVIDGLTTQSQPLYEVENSSYLSGEWNESIVWIIAKCETLCDKYH